MVVFVDSGMKKVARILHENTIFSHVHQNIVAEIILTDHTAAPSVIGCFHDTVICLSVCLSVAKCIVAK